MSPALMAVIGFVLVFGLVTAVIAALSRDASSRVASRLGGMTGASTTVTPAPAVQAKATAGPKDPIPALTDALERTHYWDRIQLELLRAGLLLRPSEALLLSLIAGLTGLAAAWMITNRVVYGVFLGGLALVGPYIYMKHRAARRQAQLTVQLPDALDMLSAALRSGYALTRGFQVISSQMHPPISEEFGRMLNEVQVGITVAEALDSLLLRTGSYDLELVIAAIQTQLTMGGNLSEVLDNISGMIRERVRLQGEINAATSEGRMSASILVAMPIAMAVIISMLNPGYLDPLFHEPLGIMLLVGAGLLMTTGVIIIKKLLDIDV